MTRPIVKGVFAEHNISNPIKHIAEDQNPIDFILKNNQTLSIKTNQRKLGKAAPQNIGQPTAETYWKYFSDFADGAIPADYKSKAKMFKRVSIARIDEVLTRYWENIFDCDMLIHFYDFLDKDGKLKSEPKYIVLNKKESPVWRREKITFTQNLNTWNESNTVKYCGVSIGEFQVHNNRNCFKFRFNMDGLSYLIEEHVI